MVLIYARDMLWYQNRLLMVLFDDAHFLPKIELKLMWWPRPICSLQVLPDQTTRSVSFFWRNKPYIDFVQKTHFKFMASSGELCQICAQLRGAPPSWILGRNGFPWSCKVKLHSLGAFWAVCQFRRALPEFAGARQNKLCDFSKSHNCPSIRYMHTSVLSTTMITYVVLD